MVGAISSTSLVSATTSVSSSDGASQKASIQAQIDAKTTELDDAETDEDKQTLTDEIAQLRARLQAIEAAEARKAETKTAHTQAAAPQPSSEPTETRIGTRTFGEDDEFGAREMWV